MWRMLHHTTAVATLRSGREIPTLATPLFTCAAGGVIDRPVCQLEEKQYITYRGPDSYVYVIFLFNLGVIS